jgi:hypothetical protein
VARSLPGQLIEVLPQDTSLEGHPLFLVSTTEQLADDDLVGEERGSIVEENQIDLPILDDLGKLE